MNGVTLDMYPRVLLVSAFFERHGGGVEIVAGKLAGHLSEQGLDVTWIAGLNDQLAAQGPERYRRVPAAFWDPLSKPVGMPAPIWSAAGMVRLWREVRRADVVHVHDYLYMPSLGAIMFAKVAKKPLVVTQHIGPIPYESRFARSLLSVLNRTVGALALRCADAVSFVSPMVQRYFDRFARIRASVLIPNGVDNARFAPAEPPPVDGEMELLFVGRFVEKKGIPLVKSCLDIPGVRWTLIGDGPLFPREGEIEPEKVRAHRRIPNDQLVGHYRAANALVLPSVGEGFPLVVQEALACGTPVIVSTDVGGAFSTCDDRCVFQVDVSSPGAALRLRQAIERLREDRYRLHHGRHHAAALARQWDWVLCADAYRSLYEAVLASTGRSLPKG